jgi:hypothetical protein
MQFDLSRASVWGHFCFDRGLDGDLERLPVAHSLAAEDCCAPNFQVISCHNSALHTRGPAHIDVMLLNLCVIIMRPCHPSVTARCVSSRPKGADANQLALTGPIWADENGKLA